MSLALAQYFSSDEPRRDRLIKLIASNPARSDREIARETGVSSQAVSRARLAGEKAGRIAHAERRIDCRGRSQPVERARSKPKQPSLRERIARADAAIASMVRNREWLVSQLNAAKVPRMQGDIIADLLRMKQRGDKPQH